MIIEKVDHLKLIRQALELLSGDHKSIPVVINMDEVTCLLDGIERELNRIQIRDNNKH